MMMKRRKIMNKKITLMVLLYIIAWVFFYAVWHGLAWHPLREQLFLWIVWWAGFLFVIVNGMTDE